MSSGDLEDQYQFRDWAALLLVLVFLAAKKFAFPCMRINKTLQIGTDIWQTGGHLEFKTLKIITFT